MSRVEYFEKLLPGGKLVQKIMLFLSLIILVSCSDTDNPEFETCGTSDSTYQMRYEWLEAKPNDEDSLFDRVRMDFDANTLYVMELYDHFGQKTVIRFSEFMRDPVFPADNFTFTPPPGVDVVSE